MSRVGKMPITIPPGISCTINDHIIDLSKGASSVRYIAPDGITVVISDNSIVLKDIANNSRILGLTRSLINNLVVGLNNPYTIKLEIVGVGYQASVSKNVLSLQVGYANIIKLIIPDIVKCVLPDANHIILTSIDKHAVGQFAANIRAVRPPEPYKGKGIRYDSEVVKRKAGKAVAG